ncbi:MAG: hypothetical protein LUC37_04435 [Prevotella sp.]|nr:hypothetical protein [Prevotella sp.]
MDVRDFIKPSARVCFYAQKLEKIDSQHPVQPSPTSVGAALKHFYVHGDTSCYNLLCRFGKEYVTRYTLEDFHGSTGTLLSSESQAASRYTKMRLSALGDKLFDGIEKDCIDKWYDNFSDTEKYPAVLPSLGFYNIVNGTTGIATGVASSIPQFNLKEVNNAMIKLLWNRDINFDEIYCEPDFVSGGIIINSDEVKDSLRCGAGKPCEIRSKITYDDQDNSLIVTEIPYGIYTDSICHQISKLVEQKIITGIDHVNDLTGAAPNIKIYLVKEVCPQTVIKQLFEHTSLQYRYPINMTMLENGTVPKLFGWREALLCHLDHEIVTRRRIHQFDINKIEQRLHIVDGILAAIDNIDEVVSLIRESSNKEEAANKLIKRFNLSTEQAEAILKMTLSRLIHLEVQSFKTEKEKLLTEAKYHKKVLTDDNLLCLEIENDLREVAEQFGDERRTICINLAAEEELAEE